MKNKVIFSVALFLSACIGMPKSKKLTPHSSHQLDLLSKKLKLEQIEYGFSREIKDGRDQTKFTISLYDIDDDNINYDSINHVLFQAFYDSEFALSKCNKIGIFYFSDYNRAKVCKVYILDKNEKIIRTSYQ